MRPPLLGTIEKGRRKGKESEAGLVSVSPDTQVKEQQICYFFLKNEVEKILQICGQQTVKTRFCLGC